MIEKLPLIFSSFNGLSFLFIVGGYWVIKQDQKETHKKFMSAALAASAVFLTLYLLYHFSIDEPVRFQKQGFIRTVYFTILISHTVLAVLIVPMIGLTVFRALKAQHEKHKKIAKLTLPLWAYVSITGVVIYIMLWGF